MNTRIAQRNLNEGVGKQVLPPTDIFFLSQQLSCWLKKMLLKLPYYSLVVYLMASDIFLRRAVSDEGKRQKDL